MSALASVVDDAKKHGLPELASRSQQAEARNAAVEMTTPYGRLVRELELSHVEGPPIKLLAAHLWAFLDTAFRTDGGMRQLFQERHASNPSSVDRPWSLIIYGDEVVPGLQLAARDDRKFWAAYASFLEFGPLTLSNELAWFTLTLKRSCQLKGVSAGASQLFRELLKDLFCGPIDPATAGIVLGDPNGVHIRLFAKLGFFLMDGDAHRCIWCCKGDAGMKMCMLCANLFTQKSGITLEDGTEMLCCSLVHEDELVFSTDADVRGTVDRLAARALVDTNAVFKKRETVVGFRHEPASILLSPELREVVKPVSQFCHDTQHTLFVTGIFNTTVFLFFETLWLGGMKGVHDAANAFLADWIWPTQHGVDKGITELFSPSRVESWRKAKHLKCTAGECLALYSVLAFFISMHILPSWPNQCRAFVLMAGMIDTFLCVPFGWVTEDALRSTIKAFLDQCLLAGWREFLHPKFHWLIHMPMHLRKFGFLPACWTLERKHKVAKGFASPVLNTADYDRTIMYEVLGAHLFALSQRGVFSTPIGPVSPHPAPIKMKKFVQKLLELSEEETASITTSLEARYSYLGTCRRGDVVMVQEGHNLVAAEIWFHVAVLGIPLTLASLWTPISRNLELRSAKWNNIKNAQLLETDLIKGACAYKRYKDYVVTLLPPHLR